MTREEAIEVLKDAKYIGSDEYASDYDREMNEAIDTVVAFCEEKMQKDKVDFLKSAKHPNQITHPYDLSK